MRRCLHAKEKSEPRHLERPAALHLEGSIAHGRAPARRIAHARVLLKADEGGDAPDRVWTDTEIASALEVSRSTVYRVRTRFAREGLEAALVHRPPRRTKPKKLDGSQEAHLIALARSLPRATSAGAFGYSRSGSWNWSAPRVLSPESS